MTTRGPTPKGTARDCAKRSASSSSTPPGGTPPRNCASSSRAGSRRVRDDVEVKRRSLLNPPRRPAWGALLRAPEAGRDLASGASVPAGRARPPRPDGPRSRGAAGALPRPAREERPLVSTGPPRLGTAACAIGPRLSVGGGPQGRSRERGLGPLRSFSERDRRPDPRSHGRRGRSPRLPRCVRVPRDRVHPGNLAQVRPLGDDPGDGARFRAHRLGRPEVPRPEGREPPPTGI